MSQLRLSFFTAIAAISLVAGIAADEEVGLLEQLKSTEQLYRTEGPGSALPEFESLLQQAIEVQDKPAQAIAQRFVGECHWLMGEFEKSREHLDAALLIGRELDDRLLVGKTLNVLGLLAWDLGQFSKAIEHFQTASDIGADTGDLILQGITLNNISLVYDELGDYRKSLEQYRQVLDLYSQIDHPRGEGETLGNIGGVYLLLGHYSEAADYYQRALVISQSLNSVLAMSQDHGNLGYAYTGLGQINPALSHFDRALELADQAGMAQEKGYWLRGKANAEIISGRYDLGLQHHRESLAAFRELGADVLLVDGLHDMGQLMLELGDPISAQQYFEQAITLAKSLERSSNITQNQIALGDLQFRHRQLDEAAILYEKALQSSKNGGETDLQATAQIRLARIYRKRQQFDEALKAVGATFEIALAQENLQAQAAAQLMQADISRLQGNLKEALALYQAAQMLAEVIVAPDLLWQIEFGRGQSLEEMGQKEDAVDALTAAVAHIESVRNRLREKRFRAGYLEDKREVYTLLVRLQLELERADDAFSTAEQLRSFSFNQQSRPHSPAGALANQLAEMRARISQLHQVIDTERALPSPERRQMAIQTFSQELLLVEQQYQAMVDDQTPSDMLRGETISTENARGHLRDGEALIEYVVGSDHIMLFVLTPDQIHTAIVPVTRQSLHSRIELMRDLLLERDNDHWMLPAASLAGYLLEPAMQQGWLDNTQQLYLVLHDVLNYLPFATLTIGEEGERQALIERFNLSYLPTATSLLHRNGKGLTDSSILAVAPERSKLRHASEEVSAIAGLFLPNAKLLSGTAATETAVLNLAGEYQVLHLATHGYFNKLNPMLSGLELEADSGNDGFLEVHEILEMQLNTELVTLSACETGLGGGFFNEIPAGDDFVGLTQAFLQAGSRSVLATLWAVDDRSTVDLMKEFYTRLEDTGVQGDKAVALAQAQRALRATDGYRHPYYWAPFVLVGAAHSIRNTQG